MQIQPGLLLLSRPAGKRAVAKVAFASEKKILIMCQIVGAFWQP